MKKQCLLLFPSLLFCFSVYAQSTQVNEQAYVLKAAQTIRYIDDPDAAIWPGFHMSTTPSILHFDSNDDVHNYAFNLNPINPNWQQLPIEEEPVYFLDHDVYNLKGLISFDLDLVDILPTASPVIIDNQASYIFSAFQDSPSDTTILQDIHTFVHERFHGYQFRSFPAIRSMFTYRSSVGARSIENIALSFLELTPLTEYLRTSNEEALKNFIALLRFRVQALDKDSARYEEQKEMIEGSAEYISWKSLHLDEAAYEEAIIKNINWLNCIPDSRDHLVLCTKQQQYYLTGNIMGIALDRLGDTHWKSLLQEGVSQRSRLLARYPMSTKEINQRVDAMKKQYHYDTLLSKISPLMQPSLDKINQQEKAYADLPGIEVRIDTPICNQEISSSNDATYESNTNKFLYANASGENTCPGNHFVFNYQHIPLFYQNLFAVFPKDKKGMGYGIQQNSFKIEPDTVLAINNEKITATDLIKTNKKIDFYELVLQTPSVHIQVNQLKGSLDASDGKVVISFQS